MPIPQSQLHTWSNQGAVTSSATAYCAVKNSLEASASPIRGKDFEIYLQGSYRNRTNIYGDSDVDIIAQLNDTFGYDVSSLPVLHQASYQANTPAATYFLSDFKRDVVNALQRHFGTNRIIVGNKAILVKVNDGRITADVIPSIQFRKFYQNYPPAIGIRFDDNRGNVIVNYPKLHIENGEAKNADARTRGWYKPTVRIFKNFRNAVVSSGALSGTAAPSYFVECLLYNAPDNLFSGTYTESLPNILNWLWSSCAPNSFVCQNGQIALFGNLSTQWNLLDCRSFVEALINRWNNWS